MAQYVKSLATSKTNYRPAQLTRADDEVLLATPEGTTTLYVSESPFAAYVVEHGWLDKGGTLNIRVREGTNHVQIGGVKGGNRNYGDASDVDDADIRAAFAAPKAQAKVEPTLKDVKSIFAATILALLLDAFGE